MVARIAESLLALFTAEIRTRSGACSASILAMRTRSKTVEWAGFVQEKRGIEIPPRPNRGPTIRFAHTYHAGRKHLPV